MATCAKPLATYTCSNASGTTCTKVAATVFTLTTNTTCPTGEYAVLSPSEYASFNTTVATVATQSGQISTLQSSDTAQGASITTLQTSSGSQGTTLSSLQNDVNLMKAGAASFTGVAGNPNPDVIAAQSTLFGLVMGAAALIWGLKKLLQQFDVTHTES